MFQTIPGIPRIAQSPYRTKGEALAVDRQGRVWTVTEHEGLWRVDGTNAVEVAGVGREAVQDALHVAPDGKLWFQDTIRGGRIARYDGRQVEHLADDESAIGEAIVTAIHMTPEGILWLGDGTGGVTRFDPVRFTFTRFGGGKDAPSAGVWKIRSGPDGALWFATDGGLYRYEEGTFVNYTKADGLPGDDAFNSAMTTDGTVWLATPRGYLAHVKQGAAAGESRFVDARAEGFEKTGVYALLADTKGGMWVAAAVSGVLPCAGRGRARGKVVCIPARQWNAECGFQLCVPY